MSSVDENTEPRSTFRLRFSLLALFIFVTLVCLLLAWWVQPNRVVATALFRVSSTQPTILGDDSGRPHDEHEYEVFKNTQLALLKSDFVLTAALRKPGVASLPTLETKADQIEWLERHLEVDFQQDSEILQIRLRGTESQTSDLVRIVDAVAKAYIDEVLYKEKTRQLTTRDMLARSLQNLNQEIANKTEEYLQIAQESEGGRDEVLHEVDVNRLKLIDAEIMRLESDKTLRQSDQQEKVQLVDQRISELREQRVVLEKKILARSFSFPGTQLNMFKLQIKKRQRLANELSAKLERLEIEQNAPSRIEQLQPAVASPAD
ncbi:MAG: hypothetical protein L0228_06930 [Planctomycetes bacterium]|nr:hypothetical protein [Planctomycetota bacterium]